MATFYPSFETILHFKPFPTEGELTLLRFLKSILDDSYEVYFNPYLNGDRPDVIIMKESHGVMIIEVKDWNLENYTLDEKKKWYCKPAKSFVKSPIDQVSRYKENLYNLHVENLLKLNINNPKYWGMVKIAIYFHCATQFEVENLLVNPFESDKKYQTFLKKGIELLGNDSLNEDCFNQILNKHYFSSSKKSMLFTDEIYQNFKRILSPSIHLRNQGRVLSYTPTQRDVISSTKLEQRVKGVFGSGKTTVLVHRAVKAYQNALKRNPNPRILILTYNMTLKNFIHDKLKQVPEEFPEENFIIINYHSFINAELNNLNIDFDVPDNLSKEELSTYLEENYYGNKELFADHHNDIVPYDAVFIDEIQDFHRVWMEIIKDNFRNPSGDYVLFGDVKQNIYNQPIKDKDVVTNVLGKPKELKRCFRSELKVQDLAESFQKNIFKDKYEIDDFAENSLLDLRTQKEGYLNYIYMPVADSLTALYNVVWENMKNNCDSISPNDITILGHSIEDLRFFDSYYRYRSHEKTSTMFETIEQMYFLKLSDKKYLSSIKEENWYKFLYREIKKKLYPNGISNFSKSEKVIVQYLTKFLAISNLYKAYPSDFSFVLQYECEKVKMSFDAFKNYLEWFKNDLDVLWKQINLVDYKKIRDNKKMHFWMNSGTIKISTINSFKGWESPCVFLIIDKSLTDSFQSEMSCDELLYTGITRTSEKLYILNFGNEEYDVKLRPIIDSITKELIPASTGLQKN